MNRGPFGDRLKGRFRGETPLQHVHESLVEFDHVKMVAGPYMSQDLLRHGTCPRAYF
jgi:hypothetical protein